MERKGVLDARLVNLLSFCVAPVGCGKCLRAPWFASVGFKQPIILWEDLEDVVQQTAPLVQRLCFASPGFAFCS